MIVLVCGDRNWKDADKIRNRLERLPGKVTIISGACRGADRMAARVARELGYGVIEVPAMWKKYGRAAGFIRNQVMLLHQPEIVIAFHSDLRSSKGTMMMITLAVHAGIAIEVIS